MPVVDIRSDYFEAETKNVQNNHFSTDYRRPFLVFRGYTYLLMFTLRGVREQWIAVIIVQPLMCQVVASGVLCHGVRLCFMYRIRTRSGFLHAARNLGFTGTSQDTRCYRLLPVVTSLWDDENVEPAGHHEAKDAPDQEEMTDDESHDVERVVVEPFKGGISETEDDGENWAREVAKEQSPDGW
jgi:hypothetical protein